LVNKLIEEGKLKYCKPEDKERRDWILRVETLNYSPLNVLTDCLKWEIPANTDVSTGYLSRLCP